MRNAPLILGITGALLLMAGLAISGGLSHDGRATHGGAETMSDVLR